MNAPPLAPLRPTGGGLPEAGAVLEAFLAACASRGLELYPEQEEAILELYEGSNVILNTPTGSGKSLVAAAFHYRALCRGERTVYTCPIKALVNEKFLALCRDFGPDNVGLMTGDASVNPRAPLLCCTAEILANIALHRGPDCDLRAVVMDEFHYYGDAERGVAWQAPLLTLPRARFLLMSATLGATGFLGEDIARRTGAPCVTVRGDRRPVPLEFEWSETPLAEKLAELLQTKRAPVYVVHFTQRAASDGAQDFMSLPVCTREEKAALQEALSGARFTSPFGKDLQRWLRHGVGVHHAGLLPRYRILVEQLAQRVMRNINAAAAVNPINLLAITLLAMPRQAMVAQDLVRQLDLYLALLKIQPYDSRITVTTLDGSEIVVYGESMKVLQRQTHKLGDVVRINDDMAVLMAYYRNNVAHLFTLPSLIACAFISNTSVRTEDIQRLAWRIYPYVAAELFLKWSETELAQVVDQTLGALAQLGVLERIDGSDVWRRPPPSSPKAIQLSLLAQASVQTIERYYLAIATLTHAGSGVLTAKALSERCQLMAQRINMLYGFNSPEFSDRAMFDQFIALLMKRSVIRTDEAGLLVFDVVLERVAADAEYVLSEQIRHSILQVTHA